MATSGYSNGAQPARNSPYLTLRWARKEKDPANNRTKVLLTLEIYSQYRVNFSRSKTGMLDGTSFTHTSGLSGTGVRKTLSTKEVWVTHGSGGARSKTFSASFNIGVSWGKSYISTLYVSTTASLDALAGKPKKPTSVTLDSTTGVPGASTTLRWSGAQAGLNNAIMGYDIRYSDDYGGSWTYRTVKTTATSGSTTVYASTVRGTSRVFRVRTNGSLGNAMHSPYTVIDPRFKTNTLPSAPTNVTSSRSTIPSDGGNVTFTVYAGSDSDGHAVTPYYSWTPTGAGYKISNNSVTLNMSSGQHDVYFWSRDALGEYSSGYVHRSISINTKPTVSISVAPTTIPGGETNYPFSIKGVATASTNKTVQSFQWYYTTSTGSLGTTGTTLSTTTAPRIDYNFSGKITESYYYRVGVQVYDGIEYSSLVWQTYGQRMPSRPSNATNFVVYNQPGLASSDYSGVSNAFFDKGLTISWTNPTVSSSQVPLSQVQVVYRIKAPGSSSFSSPSVANSYSTTAGASGLKGSVTLTSIQRGSQVQIGIKVTDSAGSTNTVYSSAIKTRVNSPTLVSGSLGASLKSIRPYTNGSSFTLTGVLGKSDITFTYHYGVEISDNARVSFEFTTGTKTTTSSTSVLTMTAAQINSALKHSALKPSGALEWNTDYTRVRYFMWVKDGFGNESRKLYTSYNNQILFIESPRFTDSASMELERKLYSGATSTKIPTSSSNVTRMVQPNELVLFDFAPASDYNGDITSYRFYKAELDSDPSPYGSGYDTYTYTLIDDVSLSQMKIVSDKINWEWAVPQYSYNKFVVFYVVAVDSQGKVSSPKYSHTYIVTTRRESPTVSISQLTVNSGQALTFDLRISDLGGSRFINSKYTYADYPNFERGIGSGVTIKIELALDGDFDNKVSSNYRYYTLSAPSGTSYSALNGATIPGTLAPGTINLSSTIFKGKKFFVRTTLTLIVGKVGSSSNRTVAGTTPTATYYVAAPTVSHRANQLGVNTNVFETKDALVISDFGDDSMGTERRYVRFIGGKGGNAYEIKIDLKEGTIDGAIIDGGSW